MHDVAVPLDRHQLGHFDRSVAADAAYVIAAKVHEHDVLGKLLGITAQIAPDLWLVLQVMRAPTRAGERPQSYARAIELAQHLWRRTEHDLVVDVKIVHVG